MLWLVFSLHEDKDNTPEDEKKTGCNSNKKSMYNFLKNKKI